MTNAILGTSDRILRLRLAAGQDILEVAKLYGRKTYSLSLIEPETGWHLVARTAENLGSYMDVIWQPDHIHGLAADEEGCVKAAAHECCLLLAQEAADALAENRSIGEDGESEVDTFAELEIHGIGPDGEDSEVTLCRAGCSTISIKETV
jgi:hypothetical protein